MESEKIDNGIGRYDVKEWQMLTFSISFSILPALMMVGTILAWKDNSDSCYTCFLTWIIIPIFLFLIFLSWLACSFFGFALVANAGESYPKYLYVSLLHVFF